MVRLFQEWIKCFQLEEAGPWHQQQFVCDKLCAGSGISLGGGYLIHIISKLIYIASLGEQMKKLSELVMIFHLYSALMINIFSYLMTFLEKWLKTSIFQDGISLLDKRILERVSPVLLETISQMGRDKRVMRKSGELQF